MLKLVRKARFVVAHVVGAIARVIQAVGYFIQPELQLLDESCDCCVVDGEEPP